MGRLVLDSHGDRTEESVLVIQDFQSEDVKREFNCSVRNVRGMDTRRAELHQEGVYSYLNGTEMQRKFNVKMFVALVE